MSFSYTFLESDNGKTFRLTATDNDGNTDSIILYCKTEIDPGEDPIEESSPTGAFPAGTEDEAFAVIYHVDEDLYTASDLNTLNDAAALYMNNFHGTISTASGGKVSFTPSTEYTNKKYYGADEKGIYVLIPINDDTANYANTIVGENYKVYVRGWCEVIDVGSFSGTQNISLQMANGYYYNIANELYLFINTKLNLVSFSEDYKSYWYKGETESDKRTFTDQSVYSSTGIYFKEHNNMSNITTLQKGEDSMMIDGGVYDIIITPSMLTSVSNFFGSSNAPALIISDQLTEIGDYAFYGSGLSGWVSFDGISKVTSIGKYAFANTSNMNLFVETNEDGIETVVMPPNLISIGEKAFYRSAGHSRNFDISKCTKLQTIGKEFFASTSNYKYFTYRRDQVEEDAYGNTALLYLPPAVMTYSLNNNLGSLKTVGSRTLSQDPVTLYTETLYDELMVLDTSITEVEKTNGLNHKTFNDSTFSGFTWICK